MKEIDWYGTDADYIHLKFGRMQKCYNFTDAFRAKHTKFCVEYEKYWNNDSTGELNSPLKIAQYVDVFNIPVHFYYNFTDTPSKSMEDIYEYIIHECSFGQWTEDGQVSWDGEKAVRKEYKVTKVEG